MYDIKNKFLKIIVIKIQITRMNPFLHSCFLKCFRSHYEERGEKR
jgi:hypothetical protein